MSHGTDSTSVPADHDLERIERGRAVGADIDPSYWSDEDEQIRAWVRAQEAGGVGGSERLARLLGDAHVVSRLLESDFADDDWYPFAEELARYGVDVLRAWIGTGAIFGKVRARTSYVLESAPMGAMDQEAVNDLSTDTVMEALRRFRDDVLRRRRWDPRKGASLKTFFIGQCLWQFPNIYRGWLRQRHRHLGVVVLTGDHAQLELAGAASPGAHDGPLQAAGSRELLDMLSVDAARRAALLLSAGYTQSEVAAELGMADAKAVENLLGHQRRRLQRQHQPGEGTREKGRQTR
jgi:hypothetical protein